MDHLHTFTAFAATYGSLDDAEAGYKAITDLSNKEYVLESFDVAVLTKDDKGKVKIVKKHEQPLRQGAWVGGGIGLATGLCVALFPAVALGAGLAWGAGIGGSLGALAGHAAAGMSRSDLKDLGELLDDGTSGLLVIAATDVEAHVERAITRAKKQEKKQVQVDADKLKEQIDAA